MTAGILNVLMLNSSKHKINHAQNVKCQQLYHFLLIILFGWPLFFSIDLSEFTFYLCYICRIRWSEKKIKLGKIMNIGDILTPNTHCLNLRYHRKGTVSMLEESRRRNT